MARTLKRTSSSAGQSAATAVDTAVMGAKCPDADAARTYLVQSPLRHDGRQYSIGERVLMTDAQAEVLVAIGILGTAAE